MLFRSSYFFMFPLTIAILGFMVGSVSLGAMLIGPLLGAFCVLLIGMIIEKKKFVCVYSALLLCLVPGAVYVFSHANSRILSFFFMLVALHMHMKDVKWRWLFLGLGMISHLTAGIIFTVLYAGFMFKKDKVTGLIKDILYAVLFACFYYVPYFAGIYLWV